VVHDSIWMLQAEHELRRTPFARHTNDHAINRSVALDFRPIAPATRCIAAIGAFSDHAFDAGQKPQPFLGEINVGSLLDQLNAGMSGGQQSLEAFSAHRQGVMPRYDQL
jgi:hypothetical protein